MILAVAVVLGIIVGFLRGGSLKRLAEVPFKHGWVAFIAIGLQVVAIYGQRLESVTPILFLVSYALLIGLIVLNRHLVGIPIVGIGLGLNTLVIAANGGYMPVTAEAVERAGLTHLVRTLEAGTRVLGAKDIILPRAETRLWFLGDVFILKGPWPTIFSVGDVLLAVGIMIFFQHAMCQAPAQGT